MSELSPQAEARDMERATHLGPLPPLPLPPIWAVCTKKCLNPLKLLDFCEAEKRIYAKLTPHTPKIRRITNKDRHSFNMGVGLLFVHLSSKKQHGRCFVLR